MANELDLSYNGSATIYAIIRRISDGYVWNGSAFAAWADGSITSYDVALTSHGGDYYAVDFPSSIGAGSYRVSYYKQAGATPAITDLRLDTEEIYWNGTTVSYTPADDYLTTLARVKEYLEISATTWDAKLTTLLGAVSRAVELYCDREFIAETRIEYHNGRDAWRNGYISLEHCPVTAISRVATCPVAAITVNNTDTTTNQRATVTVTSSGMTLSRTASGTTTTNTLAFATYTTLTSLHDAIEAVGNGWTATVLGDANDYGKWPTADLAYVQGALNARNTEAQVYLYTGELSDYRLSTGDAHATLFGYFHPGYRAIEVRYTAGYSTIPDAVQQGVVCAVKAMWDKSRVSSAGIKSEKLGDYAYTLADSSQNVNLHDPMFADARSFLNEYRRIRAL